MTIAFLGIGGAGGNLADLASERGFHSTAINFSQGNLNSLENVKYKLKLIGSDGAGHDRNLAIELMSQHYDMVINFVKDHFNNESNQIIFVTFSCGGGTGSGVAPILLDLLSATMPDKTFVAREWDHETRYFIILQNGDTLGYDFDVEAFYLNNYWNEISCDEALELLQLLA